MRRALSVTGLRGRLLLSVMAAIAVVLGVLIVAFNVVLASRLGADASRIAEARAAAEVASLRSSGTRILLPESPDERSPSILIWVFQGRLAIEQPRTLAANTAGAIAAAAAAPGQRDIEATATRLYGIPVVEGRRRLGAVVAGVSLIPYQQTRRTALVDSLGLALAILLTVGLAARWLIDRALRPVARMTEQAADWSEHDLDRRFALGPPTDELTRLASTLDELLDRLASSLRHEQRLSAEISHELRTPLAGIIAEAQFALRHGALAPETAGAMERILEGSRRLNRTLETLMAAARAQLDPQSATADAEACARAALDAAIGSAPAKRLETSVNPAPQPIMVAAESALVERILGPLVDNATRHARHAITISLGRSDGQICFLVEDDGPGVPDEEREAIFRPGYRPPSSGDDGSPEGAGLGLSLCRRLAESAGGEVEAVSSSAGARFIVRLPAA